MSKLHLNFKRGETLDIDGGKVRVFWKQKAGSVASLEITADRSILIRRIPCVARASPETIAGKDTGEN